MLQRPKQRKQAKSVATGCHRLPATFHGKQGVCRGLPPVAGGPLPEKEGVDPRPVERWIQAGATNVTFGRSAWPLPLSTFRVDRSWEGQPASNVQQRLRWAAVHGWHLDVRVYFATQHPGKRLLRTAQQELDRLLLPGG